MDDKKLDDLDETIKAFKKLVDTNGTIRRCLSDAIEEQPKPKQIKNLIHLYNSLNRMLTLTPYYTDPAEKINSAFPMSNIFNPFLYTQNGFTLFYLTEFNDALRAIMSKWCEWLNSKDSYVIILIIAFLHLFFLFFWGYILLFIYVICMLYVFIEQID